MNILLKYQKYRGPRSNFTRVLMKKKPTEMDQSDFTENRVQRSFSFNTHKNQKHCETTNSKDEVIDRLFDWNIFPLLFLSRVNILANIPQIFLPPPFLLIFRPRFLLLNKRNPLFRPRFLLPNNKNTLFLPRFLLLNNRNPLFLPRFLLLNNK